MVNVTSERGKMRRQRRKERVTARIKKREGRKASRGRSKSTTHLATGRPKRMLSGKEVLGGGRAYDWKNVLMDNPRLRTIKRSDWEKRFK
jgi:hypothetical protein